MVPRSSQWTDLGNTWTFTYTQCTHINTYTSVFVYPSIFIRTHEFALIPSITSQHHVVYFCPIPFYICAPFSCQWEILFPLSSVYLFIWSISLYITTSRPRGLFPWPSTMYSGCLRSPRPPEFPAHAGKIVPLCIENTLRIFEGKCFENWRDFSFFWVIIPHQEYFGKWISCTYCFSCNFPHMFSNYRNLHPDAVLSC